MFLKLSSSSASVADIFFKNTDKLEKHPDISTLKAIAEKIMKKWVISSLEG